MTQEEPLLDREHRMPSMNSSKVRNVLLMSICCLFLYILSTTRSQTVNRSLRAGAPADFPAGDGANPDRPIVGILSLPLTDGFREAHHLNMTDVRGVIPSSYVKWLQSAGAQVVVIPHFWEAERIESLVSKLSGVLFTGGDYGDENWNRTTAWIFHEAIRRNSTQDKLALWGTCLGFERIMQVASGDEFNAVVKAPLVDASASIEWLPKRTEFGSFMGEKQIAKFTDHEIAYNYHEWGVTPESWAEHASVLDPLFQVLGYQHTDNVTFVAMIEGKDSLPVWGVQFHPEKALFEWSPQLHYPHTETAIVANRKIADFFVSKVREITKGSKAKFDSFFEESQFAIYNYQAVFTGIDSNISRGGIFTETYIINH